MYTFFLLLNCANDFTRANRIAQLKGPHVQNFIEELGLSLERSPCLVIILNTALHFQSHPYCVKDVLPSTQTTSPHLSQNPDTMRRSANTGSPCEKFTFVNQRFCKIRLKDWSQQTFIQNSMCRNFFLFFHFLHLSKCYETVFLLWFRAIQTKNDWLIDTSHK